MAETKTQKTQTVATEQPQQGFERRGAERRGQGRGLRPVFAWLRGIFLFALFGATAILMGFTVYVLNQPIATGPVLLTLINLNILLVLVCALYIGRSLLITFLERRGRLRRSRLPFRFLGIFSIVAIIPVAVVSAYALFMLNNGLETWFSAKVSRALEGSLLVAEAYLDEHEKSLLIEAQSLARDPTLVEGAFMFDPQALQQMLRFESEARNMSVLSVYTRDGVLMSSSDASQSMTAPSDIAALLGGFQQGATGPLLYLDDETKQILVAVPVRGTMALVAARRVHADVLARIDQTEVAFREYDDLLRERGRIQVVFALFLILLALGTLAGAIWAGIRLADKIVRPVTALVHATNKVSAGELDVRLNPKDDDEMGILTQAFNRMTQQLKHNTALVERKNKELDTRRKTMEALLTGVSAGVLAVAPDGTIKTLNQTARRLLGLNEDKTLHEQLPELGDVLDAFLHEMRQTPREVTQEQVKVSLPNGETRTLLVRMVPQRVVEETEVGVEVSSVVMTCDDITPLISAQKTAAWGDVARRLAHEIKNPLTPIQLSAERLRRKYAKSLPADDKELFDQLTATIIRQTEDMRGMLNEFSDFARMPSPELREENVVTLLEEVLVLEKTARKDIQFEFMCDVPVEEAQVLADRSHISRVVTNVIENAVNAIHERTGKKLPTGEIKIVVKRQQPDTLLVQVLDNGRGLPSEVATEDLFDPYVTTRKKGTGLGLAIVRRVMADHNGDVRLSKRQKGGTCVELVFPALPTEAPS